MAGHEVWDFQVTIPAGVQVTAPVTIATPFPPRRVIEIHWRVPNGPRGLMGWRITSAQAQIIPRALGTWMINDGQQGVWHLENLPDSGAWEVTAYNLGNNPHAVYLSYVTEIIKPPEPTPVLFAPPTIFESPDLSQAGAPVGGR